MTKQVNSKYPDINNYELTFKVSGLSFLFTDMLIDGFNYFDPLFASDSDKNFYQYYTNEKVNWALEYGLNWLSKPDSFTSYQSEFHDFYESGTKRLDKIIDDKKITPETLKEFFEILGKIFSYDTKLDNKFTDKAYYRSKENLALQKNLELLSGFKNDSRVWINKTFLEPGNSFSRFIEKLNTQFSIKSSQLENYKISELYNLFDGDKISDEAIIDRQLSYIIYYLNNQRSYITGKESDLFIQENISKSEVNVASNLTGQVANKSKKLLRGKVCVINVDYGDMGKIEKKMSRMEKDSILVAEFTAPELMPACKKAKAIITDIGGLLSHAAIISRELKIPCIVGVENATKILKDGDEVEVDADEGVVKRLD